MMGSQNVLLTENTCLFFETFTSGPQKIYFIYKRVLYNI